MKYLKLNIIIESAQNQKSTGVASVSTVSSVSAVSAVSTVSGSVESSSVDGVVSGMTLTVSPESG